MRIFSLPGVVKYAAPIIAATALLISVWSLAYSEGFRASASGSHSDLKPAWGACSEAFKAGRMAQLEVQAKWQRDDMHGMALCTPGTLEVHKDGSWQCQY